MWFEILPAFGVMVGAIWLGASATFWVPQLMIGRQYYRRWDHVAWKNYWFRDMRLGGGDPYNSQGLDRIPDEDAETEKKQK